MKNNWLQLLKLSYQMDKQCVIMLDGAEKPLYSFDKLENFINRIHDGSIDDIIPEFCTYNVSFVCSQMNLLSDDDEIIFIYMV